MDISQIYMASPDWIKALMVALPFLTVYATARLFARGPKPSPEPAAAPVTVRHMPATSAQPALYHDTPTAPLITIMEPIKDDP